ncbi:hypothetical protein [Deinococcus multiflagellatus]|uniref:Uncharacterized protein n=1 Tax=Deinococcus multiflagellatus TaxID=1656887 RepID=A0ABW1ZNP1_9DEIO
MLRVIPSATQDDASTARDFSGPQVDGSKTFHSLAVGAVKLEHHPQLAFEYYSFTGVDSGTTAQPVVTGKVRALYPSLAACEGDWGKSGRAGLTSCLSGKNGVAGPYFTQDKPDQPVRFNYYYGDGKVSPLTAAAPDTVGVLPSGILVTPFFAPQLESTAGTRTPYVRSAYTWDDYGERWTPLNVTAQRAVYQTPDQCHNVWGEACRSSGGVFYSPIFYGGYYYPYSSGSSTTVGKTAYPLTAAMAAASTSARLEAHTINAAAVRMPSAVTAPSRTAATPSTAVRGLFGSAARSGAS